MVDLKTTSEVIGPDHPISQLANALSDDAEQIASAVGLSKWDFCQAMANACGQILADSKGMPREHALHRMDALRKIMQGAYDLRDVEGAA